MKHIKFEETIPHVIHPQKINEEEKLYRTGAPDFKLSSFSLQNGKSSSFESATGEILLIINGNVLITTGMGELELGQGEAAFVLNHQCVTLKTRSQAYLFRASVPVHSGE